MRPASEIHSALDLLSAEAASHPNVDLARAVLAWVVGGRVDLDGPHAWLCGYLLDDPPQIDDTPPERN
jgi:hypothetical protein